MQMLRDMNSWSEQVGFHWWLLSYVCRAPLRGIAAAPHAALTRRVAHREVLLALICVLNIKLWG